MLLYLQKLKTSGGDHLTGNLEPDELVYWSSNTNLRRYQRVAVTPWASRSERAETASYLVMPKSDTFTTRESLTRQFLDAFGESNTRQAPL